MQMRSRRAGTAHRGRRSAAPVRARYRAKTEKSAFGTDRGATCELWPATRSRHSRGARTSTTALAISREVTQLESLPRACAVFWLIVIGLCTIEGYCTGGRPLSLGARPWCDVRAVASNAHPAFAWHVNRRHCTGCLSGGGETRELAARAPCRAGYDESTQYRVALHWRKTSLFLRKAVVRRASCGLQRTPGIRMAHEQAPLRWLSLGRWRNTRACRTRAPCRADFDRPTQHIRALHRRKASLFRRKIVVRRASCGL